ncbi:MAG: PIN domain-containing protein [Roseburia sp.]|nr:PIN domain-containing protein [Roseburia sp.]MCM1242831.1 PIN domain-containing protein [Roseburia sp.]
MFYILRKDYNAKERKEILANLCSIFDIEGIDKVKLISGLQNEDFLDFEDCLQMECAKTYEAEYIVTRDIDDYKFSEIKAILPKDYLKLL